MILLPRYLPAHSIPHPKADYRIVFIHLGSTLPPFLLPAISQAHEFCPDAEIILIANHIAIDSQKLPSYTIIVEAENIQKTLEHQQFIHTSTLDKGFREGFWYFTTERLFYLDDFISQYDLKNTFHMENDNLIYVNLKDLLPVFVNNYPGIAAPFDSDDRGFANLIFVKNKKSIRSLTRFFVKHAKSGKNEMVVINEFKIEFGENYIDHLPTIMKEYVDDYGLINAIGKICTIDPQSFYKHIDQFNSLFDCCALGQYLGGIDPRNGSTGEAFINETSFYNLNNMKVKWEMDPLGRKIPYLIYNEKKLRINNLHIHSKDLKKFTSLHFPSVDGLN